MHAVYFSWPESYVQVWWVFLIMILEELCQRKFFQEEEVEVSCNGRGECSGVWKAKRVSILHP